MSKDYSLFRLQDMAKSLEEYSQYLKNISKRKSCLLEFTSDNDRERSIYESRDDPERFYSFRFLDLSVDIVRGKFKIDDLNGNKIFHKYPSNYSFYHIRYYGFEPTFNKLLRYDVPLCSEEHFLGNYTYIEEALPDFKRACLDLCSQLFGSNYDRFENYLFSQKDFDIF